MRRRLNLFEVLLDFPNLGVCHVSTRFTADTAITRRLSLPPSIAVLALEKHRHSHLPIPHIPAPHLLADLAAYLHNPHC